MKERIKIWAYRLIWTILLATVVLLTIFLKVEGKENIALKVCIGVIVGLFVFAFWLDAFLVNYKTYCIGQIVILVYAGYFHHYIKVNGTIYDEHNTLVYLTPIVLSTTVNGMDI